MRISEPDLVLPALLVISGKPGVNTSTIIYELTQILRPVGEDAEILRGRSDTKFSQIVRNLVSHETLEELGYATYTREGNRHLGGNFYITQGGQSFLDENQETIENLLLHGFQYDSVVSALQKISEATTSGKKPNIINENLIIREGRQHTTTSVAYERSDAVRRAAIEYYRRKDGHIGCEICGFDFLKVYGERGRDYIEIHHEKPLFETEGKERKAFLSEAVQSVKPVCPNCHKMIHRSRDDFLSVPDMKKLIMENELNSA